MCSVSGIEFDRSILIRISAETSASSAVVLRITDNHISSGLCLRPDRVRLTNNVRNKIFRRFLPGD